MSDEIGKAGPDGALGSGALGDAAPLSAHGGGGSGESVPASRIAFNEAGLVPAVIVDDATGDVLMMAWMNKESVRLTFETGTTWFWSRSRGALWNKGETSGNVQRVVSAAIDCDRDCLLFRVKPAGPACHTGNRSCFFRELRM